MSDFHRDHPELVGTADDPWMTHEAYRKALDFSGYPDACTRCGTWIEWDTGLCDDCKED